MFQNNRLDGFGFFLHLLNQIWILHRTATAAFNFKEEP